MKKIRRGLLILLSAFLVGGCDFSKIFEPSTNGTPTSKETTLVRIEASNYKKSVEQDSVYTFDGVVNAYYSDKSTKEVNNYVVGELDTTSIGNKELVILYTEKNVTVSTTLTIEVNKTSYEDKIISAEEAVAIIDKLVLNVISIKEYYVRGIVASCELDGNGFNGTFLNTNLKFRSTQGNGIASKAEDILGKEVVILGYLENYNSIYQIPYLPANYSPTGEKYYSKLISVKDVESQETPLSDISISPINKTLEIGEESSLSVTFYPVNATNKSLTWSSTNDEVCSVSNDGIIKGNSIGNALITARSTNGKEATCNVTVIKGQSTDLDGEKFAIEFNHFESDGQTELTTTTVLDQIVAGSDFIESVNLISKVYKGMNGLKFGSARTGGSISFNLSNEFQTYECKKLILEVYQYGSKTTTVTVYGNNKEIISGSSSTDEIAGSFEIPQVLNSIKITTSSRTYISKIILVCEECLSRNYTTEKNKLNTAKRVVIKKYCPTMILVEHDIRFREEIATKTVNI